MQPATLPQPTTLLDLILPLLVIWSLVVQVKQLLPHRRHARRGRPFHAVVALGALALLLVSGPNGSRPSTALAQSANASGATEVSITPTGFQPPLVTVNLGQSIQFTNATSQPQTITHDGASTGGTVLFDSGAIPPGGGYSVAVLVAGDHVFRSSANPSVIGTLKVSASGLPGPITAPARDQIPDLAFPVPAQGDMATHPRFGIAASRTRVLLGVEPSATVGEVNAALGAANVSVLGGLPSVGMLLVGAPDSNDYSAITAALQVLRSSPAISFAALSTGLEKSVVPRPQESGMLNPNSGFLLDWAWDDRGRDGLAVVPKGENASLQASRVPPAWNLLQAITTKNASVQTAIVDGGFEAHPDLGRLDIGVLCRPGLLSDTCTYSDPDDHGNHVAGIVGATHDNDSSEAGRSVGVAGVNPVAQMIGLDFGPLTTTITTGSNGLSNLDSLVQTLTLAISHKGAGGQLPNLRVINLSAGAITIGEEERTIGSSSRGVALWEDAFAGKTCGPLANDDAAGGQLCTPENEDTWLVEYEQIGRAALAVARQAAAADVVIVKASGNKRDKLCAVYGQVPCSAPGPRLSVWGTNEFAWAVRNWGAGTPPVVIVESYAIGEATVDYRMSDVSTSQQGGHVSAPGVNVWSTGSSAFFNDPKPDCERGTSSRPGATINFRNSGVVYCSMGGTSMATPHVAGLIGLLAAFKPDLTYAELISAVKDRADGREFEANGVAPRMDAYASLLSLPGALAALLDVNDQTPDGNQRVVLGPSTTDTPNELGLVTYLPSVQFPANPDGKIDMRDFRRFRDAWLQVCDESNNENAANWPVVVPADCPGAGAVQLNGPANHSKKDLNWDHCVFISRPAGDTAAPRDPNNCDTRERAYPRADFNGDGRLDSQVRARVPFGPTGQPLENGMWANMTDLEALLSLWPSTPDDTEGWTRAEVPDLMVSGDVQVHASAFFELGANEVTISARDMQGRQFPQRKLPRNDGQEELDQNYIVMTLPAGPFIDMWASATLPDGQRIESPLREVHLAPGQDKRFDMCASRLTLEGGPLALPANGSARATFTASLAGCAGEQVANRSITFSLTADNGQGDATLTRASGQTDANGRLVTSVTAGQQVTDYTLEASVDLGNGRTVKASKKVRATPPLTISYIWHQKVLEWEELGSTRWPNAPANMPDCTTAGVPYCIDNFRLTDGTEYPEWFSEGLQREGRLVGGAEEFKLSEEVAGVNWSTATYTVNHNNGGDPDNLRYLGTWGPLVSDHDKYQNHPLPGVRAEDMPDAVRLYGLRHVGELGYLHGSQVGGGHVPNVGHFTRSELLLIPRGDGSAIQHSFDMDRPITFERRADGTFEPYTFRGVFQKPIVSPIGYDQDKPSDWVFGAWDQHVDTEFNPGDQPRLQINGHLKVVYCFQAVVTYGVEPLPTTLPDCSQNRAPVADFDVVYAPNGNDGEGRVVHFKDRSNDPDNDIRSWAWEFGEPANPDRKACEPDKGDSCHLYADNGIYTARLTVTDSEGLTHTVTKTVTVRNLPPEPVIYPVIGRGPGNQPGCGQLTVSFRLWDPGWLDQEALDWRITSTTPAWPGNASGTGQVGNATLTISNLPVGEYPLTLTVIDKDGGTASRSAMARVVDCGDPPPPPQPAPGPYITCDVNVVLDGEELAFLNALNAYRIQNGVAPLLGVSPTLTRAAERHTADMTANNFMSHTGSDASTFFQRAKEANFPGNMVGENLLRGSATGDGAIFGWKSSKTGHNENMLKPAYKSIGISRQQRAESGEWFWATSFGDVLDCPIPAPVAPVAASLASSDGSDIVVLGAGEPQYLPRQQFFASVMQAATAAVAAQQSAPTSPPAPAFVVSHVSPLAGQVVQFTNASRDRTGQPIAATLVLGDGTPNVTLAPGASHEHTFASAGAYAAKLEATDGSGLRVSVSRQLEVAPGLPIPPLGAPGDALSLGENADGQLGNGAPSGTPRSTPVGIANLVGAVSVTGGEDFSVALLRDGSVWAWGNGDIGQTGDGTFDDAPTAVPVGGLTRVRAISTAPGGKHTLALDADGAVWAWGASYRGQVGDGGTTQRELPVRLNGLPPMVAVAAGDGHSLALAADGGVWAWGDNLNGQLGDGTTTRRTTPVRVRAPQGQSGLLADAVAIAAGNAHSLAISADGTVWAWGDNRRGQLGTGTSAESWQPTQVVNLGSVSAIAAGYEHSLALRTDGTVWGWGDAAEGQLGRTLPASCTSAGGFPSPCSRTPVQAPGVSDATAIAAGSYHSLALRQDGSVWGWGANHDGQIGEADLGNARFAPAPINGLTNALAVAGGYAHTLAIRTPSTAPAAPANDNFLNAAVLTTDSASITSSTMLATLETGEPTATPCGAIGRTVWYRIVPHTSGKLAASTVGSLFDARLALYTGTSLATLSRVACDDNGGGDRAASLLADVIAGETYYLQVGGATGFPGTAHAGTLSLSVSVGSAPANDGFANAAQPSLPLSTTGTTVRATLEPGEDPSTCLNVGRSVWWRFTPSINGVVVARAQSSDFRPVLDLYTGTSLATLQSEECAAVPDEDDTPTLPYDVRFAYPVTAGQTYYLRLAGEQGVGGSYSFDVSVLPRPANDDFVNATALSAPTTVTGNNLSATREQGERDDCADFSHSTVWYRVVSPVTGRLDVSVTGDFNFGVAVFDGSAVADLDMLGCGLYWDGAPQVSESVMAGQPVYVRISVGQMFYPRLGGEFTMGLAVTPLADLAPTMTVEPFAIDQTAPVTLRVDNNGSADTLVGFKVHLFSAQSVPPTTAYNPLLEVSFPPLAAGASRTLVANLPPDRFLPGTHTLGALVDRDVDVEQANYSDNDTQQSIVVTAPQILGRDAFAQALLLPIPSTVEGSTREATTETGEPTLCGSTSIGRTVWYRLQPTASGALSATTAGSSFDSILAVYRGTQLGSLQQVACNDDERTGVRTSRLTTLVSAGETYYIQLGGWGSASGAYTLDVSLDASAKPDLVVSAFSADATTADRPINVLVTVANEGPLATPAGFDLRLYPLPTAPQAGEPSPFAPIVRDAPLAPGTSVNLTAALPAGSLSAGVHRLWILADGAGAVSESDETNNATSTQVPVGEAPPPPTAPDFGLTVAPGTLSLVPGGSANFTVTVTSMLGFDQPVALSASGLPAGISATFYPSIVTPTGTSTLVLVASSSLTPAPYALNITGSSGALSRSIGASAAVNFGLVPICTGTFTGRVVDKVTQQGIVGATVTSGSSSATTGPDGVYTLTGIQLGANNAPAQRTMHAAASNYWAAEVVQTAICDVPQTPTVELQPKTTGQLVGSVLSTGTQMPIAGASVRFVNPDGGHTVLGPWSASSGQYTSEPIQLNPGNTGITYMARATGDGHWLEQRAVTVTPGAPVEANFSLVPTCTGSITGYAQLVGVGRLKNQSITFRQVMSESMRQMLGPIDYDVTTDPETGEFNLPGALLGHRNSAATYEVPLFEVNADNKRFRSKPASVALAECGASQSVAVQLEPVPTGGGGTPDGATVTGTISVCNTTPPQPLNEVGIANVGGAVALLTGPNGQYQMVYELSGPGPWSANISARKQGWWTSVGSVDLSPNSSSTLNLCLVQKQYGQIDGLVRDASTQAPISAVRLETSPGIALPGTSPTGSNGLFTTGDLELSPNNQPIQLQFTAEADGYWPRAVSATVTAGTTTHLTIDLLKQCPGATISGKVINAFTRQPLLGARVEAGGSHVFTDKDGLFTLSDLVVGPNNAPAQATVTVTASGFHPQSKVVTIFCGANIELDFGQPQVGLGAISGTVTDISSGTPQPMSGVFVAGAFGGSATTGQNGAFTLSNVPVNADGSARNWEVTVVPPAGSGFPTVKRTVTVEVNKTATLNVQFGTPPQTPDLVVSELTASGSRTDLAVSLTLTLENDGYVPVSAGAKVAIFADLAAAPVPGTAGALHELTLTQPLAANGSVTLEASLPAGTLAAGAHSLWVLADATGSVTELSETNNALSATVTLVRPNTAPMAAVDTYTTPESTLLSVAAPGVLTNDTDAEDTALTAVVASAPAHGTLTLNADGSFTYQPTAGYSGPDNFTYRASDGVLQSAPATVGVTVTPVNRAPGASAVSVSTSTGEAVTVTLAATDPDGDPLTFSVVTQPAHGTLGPISGNQVTYTPANGYTGSDGFTYRASDGLVHSAAATVSVAVTGAPDLALAKTHTGSFTVGTNGKYTLTVSNVGSAPTSGPITLVDSLPAGLSYVSFTGTGWTCSAAAPNVACSRTQALAPQATSTVTLTVSVAAAAVPSVVNSAIVSLEGDTNATNNSAEDPTTVNQTADKAKPYCQVTRVATDAQGRQFVEVTIRDTGSGLKSIQITKQTNISIAIPTFPVGSKETYLVVGTKVDQASPAQIELKVTDVAGNYILCDPVMTVITKLPNQPERQVFGELPEAEHLVQVRNGSPNGVKQLVIEVNNKKFTLKDLEPGEIRRLDIASAMKQGDNNKVVLESHGGKKGAWIEVLIADSLPPWEDDPEQEPTLDGERRRPASPAAPASPGAPTAPATSTVPAEPTLSSVAPTAQTGQQPAVPTATPVPTVTPQTQATPQPSATPQSQSATAPLATGTAPAVRQPAGAVQP